jgi:acyl-CoA thioesterase-1
LWNAWYDYTIVNAWKSGDTSAWMLARIDRVTEEAQPWDLALLVIWANDWLQSLPLDQLTDNMHSIIAILQAKQIDIIIWWMELPTNLDPIYREQFSALYSNISEEYGLPLIPFFLEDVAKEWYAIIANNMLTFLQQEELISK